MGPQAVLYPRSLHLPAQEPASEYPNGPDYQDSCENYVGNATSQPFFSGELVLQLILTRRADQANSSQDWSDTFCFRLGIP